MLKEHSTLVKHAAVLGDILLLAALFWVSHRVVGLRVALEDVIEYWAMFLGFLVFYVYFAWTRSLFSVQRFNTMRRLGQRTLAIFFSAAVLGAAILYLLPDVHTSRQLYLAFVGISCVSVCAEKWLLCRLVAWLHCRGHATTPVLLFGRGRALSQLAKDLEMHPQWGLRIRAKLDAGVSLEEFERVLRSAHVEEVLFCVPRSLTNAGYDLDPYLQLCEQMGRPTRVFMNLPSATYASQWEYHPFMGRPTMIAHAAGLDPDQLLLKRLFDIAGAAVGCALLALFTPLAACAIKLSSPGPVLCGSGCLGRNGRRFTMYRFRCTRQCHDETEAYTDGGSVPWGGALVRALGWEHFPQFVNVLRGEMSLVGTRPCALSEMQAYKKWHHRRSSFKPGMTGPWHIDVSARGGIDDAVRLDLAYIDSWSIPLDMAIIVRTVFSFGTRRRRLSEGVQQSEESA
ncbi:MAG: hypothetical protein GF331_20430 [Chitinivibrionales bacterium]|nr:hypothetical protein [Chitinivibrionales bacterium]